MNIVDLGSSQEATKYVDLSNFPENTKATVDSIVDNLDYLIISARRKEGEKEALDDAIALFDEETEKEKKKEKKEPYFPETIEPCDPKEKKKHIPTASFDDDKKPFPEDKPFDKENGGTAILDENGNLIGPIVTEKEKDYDNSRNRNGK